MLLIKKKKICILPLLHRTIWMYFPYISFLVPFFVKSWLGLYTVNIVQGQNKKEITNKQTKTEPWDAEVPSPGAKRLGTVATFWTKRAFIISKRGNHEPYPVFFSFFSLYAKRITPKLLQIAPWVKPSVSPLPSAYSVHTSSLLLCRCL